MTRPTVHDCPHCVCDRDADNYDPGTVDTSAPFYGLVVAVITASRYDTDDPELRS